MKVLDICILWMCLFVSKCHAGQPASAEAFRIFNLPDFSMELTLNETGVEPTDVQWPLVVVTNLHLTSYMKRLFDGDRTEIENSDIRISLRPSIQVDDDAQATSTFPEATVINASFDGEVYFSDVNQATMVSQSLVENMVQQAFTGGALRDLLNNIESQETLRQIVHLQVWVTLPSQDDVNKPPHEAEGRIENPNSSSRKNQSLKIAAAACIVSFVVFVSVSMFAYLRVRKVGKDRDECSTSDESMEEDASVFSTEYWKDAWAQAAGQVKPRPPRRQRQFKRQPSSVKPNLDSIQEGEEEEEWEDTAWDGDNPMHSISIWMAPAVVEPTGDQPNVENDEEMGIASPSSSEGSFFKDEDPNIALSKPSNAWTTKKKERHDSKMRSFRHSSKEKHAGTQKNDEISIIRNQIMSKTKPAKDVCKPKVDELTAVRNRILAKKKEQEVEEPAVDELTMVRNRVLAKSMHGKKDVDGII